ncbi:MAG: hypothetical protein US40_C0003G0080 [Candidatus Roizmanbacteria bacterium GW2011_GWC2_37_13]|uniref:MPN domain-containing protein n=1 Tax=Candidatus Roizmanbacteria bacterium GW2011_GWC2_37_13 TaxID=1618486 RepID=A0A0G0G553_9BACT|nr:MAG: hypothetical protein US38_C0004G0079 [Candidatus Roizmanbacteria bacterium GW2011_GWC1_37_12]KKQ26228.1 MAG: hypothetical protein US40_C0003G0080 [Candidatus Roizmanbacteria bacterium GW2011_GWC2_37_13]
MPTLHDLPADERPRERLIKYGVEVLSLQELLALIFGRGTRGEPVMNISQKLLSKFGSLENLSEASVEDLKTVKGLGLAKACQIKACFEMGRRLQSGHSLGKRNLKTTKNISPENIYQQIRSKIVNYNKEHLLVTSLDNRNKIIGIDTVSVGTLNSNLIHPRETFEAAIKRHAAQIIICHNHPSGELTPSEDDLKITKDLVAAGNILGIKVIDHLIITKDSFYSLAKDKLI